VRLWLFEANETFNEFGCKGTAQSQAWSQLAVQGVEAWLGTTFFDMFFFATITGWLARTGSLNKVPVRLLCSTARVTLQFACRQEDTGQCSGMVSLPAKLAQHHVFGCEGS